MLSWENLDLLQSSLDDLSDLFHHSFLSRVSMKVTQRQE